ncbi:DUF3122 domain-containing protein [Pseudanabaena sp. FACHB-2040]|uniref:DUF3122 domain-containing protein n=1 Tax=Pseudanabaena sp. FACHB-2040 TaxID=2692859 RepID=UPI001683F459|nr:DUF3122 domain-containing protein [Pseudanabaena sp. FACHB-2040]MBD2260366.1 DUF3122 domain-containing protein [Pseudanabaena sp. FACHB-2040]
MAHFWLGGKPLQRWLVGLLLALVLVWAAPAAAATHTYHERPGQTTYRSQQSLRDRTDRAWQATLFKRFIGGELQGIYLRLVGFPGMTQVAAQQPLQISTGTGLAWQAASSLDPQTQNLPDNVGQYDLQPVLADLKGAIPLELVVPLRRGEAHLAVAPFVVEEWRSLRDQAETP